MSLLQEVQECLICYDTFTKVNMVILGECRHRLCEHCVFQLMVQKKDDSFRCVMDNKIINEMYMFNNSKLVTKTGMKYLKDSATLAKIWPKKLKPKFEKMVVDAYKLRKNLMSYMFGDKYDISIAKESLSNESLNLNLKKLCGDIESEFRVWNSDIDKFLRSTDYEDGLSSVEEVRILRDNLYCFRSIYELCSESFVCALYNYMLDYLTFLPSDSYIKSMKETENILKKEINIIQKTYLYPVVIVVSKYRENTELYRKIYRHMDYMNINQCLICTEVIQSECFGTSFKCAHKICMRCLEMYLITEVICPIDGNGICDLYIHNDSDETKLLALDYLIKTLNKNILENSKEHFQSLRDKISRIRYNDKVIWEIVYRIKQFCKYVKQKKSFCNSYKKILYIAEKYAENEVGSYSVHQFSAYKNFLLYTRCLSSLEKKYKLTNNVDRNVLKIFKNVRIFNAADNEWLHLMLFHFINDYGDDGFREPLKNYILKKKCTLNDFEKAAKKIRRRPSHHCKRFIVAFDKFIKSLQN